MKDSIRSTAWRALLVPGIVSLIWSGASFAVAPSADLSIIKDDGVTSATPGGQVTYTITASNAGPDDVTGATVTDTFPADLSCSWTCVPAATNSCTAGPVVGNINDTMVDLINGGSVVYTAVCDIDSAATGTLSNTATIADAATPDPVPGNNSSTDSNTVLAPEADLSVTKTDGVTSATPGGMLTYTIVASNTGPSDDPAASLTDTFPADLTCTYTSVAAGGATGNTAAGAGDLAETLSLPAGSSVTYTVSCNIDPAATGTLSNTATITASVTDSNAGNDSATDADTILVPEADLAVTKTDGVTSATPGGTLTYTIVASNAGPSVDPAASLTDTFPADLTCTYTSVAAGGATGNTAAGAGDLAETLSLPVGSSVTYTASCDIAPGATGTLSNTATVAASITDPNAANDSATDADTVLAAEADLSVTKDDGQQTALPGQSITYTVVAANAGPSDATGATLTDTLPASLTCTFTSAAAGGATGNTAAGSGDLNETLDLPAGSSVTYTLSCTIDAAATGTISNTASITSAATDPNAGNNSATDDTVLNITTITSNTPNPSAVTQPVTVSYTVSGISPTGNVTVSDGVTSCVGTVAAGSCDITFDSPGARMLTAAYAGDGTNLANTSEAVAHTVNEADTVLTILGTDPGDPIPYFTETEITFDLTIAPFLGGVVPTGTVTITDGTDMCEATLPATSCVIAFTTSGDRLLTGTYSGDDNFNGVGTVAPFAIVVGAPLAVPTVSQYGLIILLLLLSAVAVWHLRRYGRPDAG